MANKKISDLPFLGNTGYTASDIMPIVTYYSAVTGTTVHTPITDFVSYVLSGVTTGVTQTTYSNLLNLISTSGLNQGYFYLIVDYKTCYDQPDFDSGGNPIIVGNYKQGPVEPIIVFATSVNTISEVAYQPLYPNDRIRYDVNFNSTELTGGPAFGRIKERIDEFNNRTDYDHRNVYFKRYLESTNTTRYNVIYDNGLPYVEVLTFGSPAYNNFINDYTKTSNFILSNNVFGKDSSNNIIGFTSYNNTFGTNTNNNILSNFSINNIIGDYFERNKIGDYFGNGKSPNFIGNYFRDNLIGNYFGLDDNGNGGNKIGTITTVYYNSLEGPVSGITLINGGTGYSDSTNVPTVGGNNDMTVDILTNISGVITGVTINNPGTYYSLGGPITITTGGNDATLNVTGITGFQIGDVVDNGIGNTAEVATDNGVSAMTINFYSGFFSNGDVIDNLSDTRATVDYVDFTLGDSYFDGNNIGNHFINNNIGKVFSNNQIGNYFGSLANVGISNYILDEFTGNTIANFFGIDIETPDIGDGGNIIRNRFIGNKIGDSFIYNTTIDTSGGGYNDNVIGWGFNNNIFADSFNYNKIGDLFQFNIINDYFAGNKIGYFFWNNQINSFYSFNLIGDISWFNTIGSNFNSNIAGTSFVGNIVGDDFQHNKVSTYCGIFPFAGNTWGSNIYDNIIGDHFLSNQIGDNFISNNIGTNFQDNTVGNDFKYNITQYDVISQNFTTNPATHVYGSYTCTIFTNSSSTLRLSYYDALDNLIITDPDL